MKPNNLAVRRDRRILRSKVYLILKDSSHEERYLDELKRTLSPKELENVIDDATYFIPFPDKLENILEHSKTISQLIDNVKTPKKNSVKSINLRSRKKMPSVLLPRQRIKSFFKSKKLEISTKKNEFNDSSQFLFRRLFKKIDQGRSLIKNSSFNKINETRNHDDKNNIYKDFHDAFYKINSNYHYNLKKKYEEKLLLKNRTRKKIISINSIAEYSK